MKLEYHKHLQSSVKMNEEHPDTFWIPEKEVRENLTPGSFNKITLHAPKEPGETFWVKVLARVVENEKIFYIASIENDLVYHDGRHKDLIIFGPDHVRQNEVQF